MQRDVVRPAIMNELRTLGLDVQKVWPGLPPDDWTFWNAQLFRVATAWTCARWLQHLRNRSFGENWRCSLFARCRIGTIGANRSSESPLCRQPFFGQAGLAEEAGQARGAALRCVEKAVRIGTSDGERHVPVSWRHSEVIVEGPARIDTGGG